LHQLDRDRGAAGADEPDVKVDLAEHQDESLSHRQDHEHGALLEEVHQVGGRQEDVVGADDLEDRHDHDHRNDHRQDAALAGTDADAPGSEVLAEGLSDDLRRDFRLGGFGGRGQVGRAGYRLYDL